MVELTNMNDVAFVLSGNLIETIELIPETKAATTTGKYFLMKEKPEEVVQEVIVYNRKIFQNVIRALQCGTCPGLSVGSRPDPPELSSGISRGSGLVFIPQILV